AVGENAVKPSFRAGTADLEFGHRRHFDEADRIADRFNFLADTFALFRPAPAVLIPGFHTLRRKPVRHFPTVEAAPDSPQFRQAIVGGRSLLWPGCRHILPRIMLLSMGSPCFAHFFAGPVLVGVVAKTTRIEIRCVD